MGKEGGREGGCTLSTAGYSISHKTVLIAAALWSSETKKMAILKMRTTPLINNNKYHRVDDVCLLLAGHMINNIWLQLVPTVEFLSLNHSETAV